MAILISKQTAVEKKEIHRAVTKSCKLLIDWPSILEMHNQTNYKCWPKFVQTDNASSSIKMAIKFYFIC